jgi:hypothetical protein
MSSHGQDGCATKLNFMVTKETMLARGHLPGLIVDTPRMPAIAWGSPFGGAWTKSLLVDFLTFPRADCAARSNLMTTEEAGAGK